MFYQSIVPPRSGKVQQNADTYDISIYMVKKGKKCLELKLVL
jgi:hypothetical protein